MRTDTFDYDLPPGLIAQDPLPVRDTSRLMVVDRAGRRTSHHSFRDLPGFLRPGDCLVVNTSRVIPARLAGTKEPTGGAVELLLLENTGGDRWKAMSRGAALRPGVRLSFAEGALSARVVEGPLAGQVTVDLEAPCGNTRDAIEMAGQVPLPPYITHELPDGERYQTVYAEREISAAAPTAGLHFTPALLDEIGGIGVAVARLELAVGMDTFVPVREELTEDHRMHSEWYSLDDECAAAVNAARSAGGRAVAVGTTSVRVLESCADEDGTVSPASGYTDIFITPGYRFKAVDALITNFHFPRSTLIMLVCAFAGTDLILASYEEAVRERYRFYSFGDAMLLV
jgi:S-adenosylmethionine:tRNA ribosyltransferase-isomerase